MLNDKYFFHNCLFKFLAFCFCQLSLYKKLKQAKKIIFYVASKILLQHIIKHYAKKPKIMTNLDIDKLDKVYTALLAKLELSEKHFNDLKARGFSAEETFALGFKTFPLRRKPIAIELSKQMDVSGVPGFYTGPNNEWLLAGAAGLAIPVRNQQQKIVGIKIRADKPKSTATKYTSLSSNPKPTSEGNSKYPNGTRAAIHMHWPLPQKARGKVLRITEGELKAELATSFTGVYTISLPGVNNWRMALTAIEAEKPDRVLLAFDADKLEEKGGGYDGTDSTNTTPAKRFEVGVAMAKLYKAVRNLGIACAIEDWPATAGKGIDDVLMDGNVDQIKQLEGEPAEAMCKNILLANMPDGWVYINGIKRFVHCSNMLELDKEQFADRHSHTIKGNAANKALENPAFLKYDLPMYDPNKEPLVEENGVSYFNYYRPSGMMAKAGDATPFLQHMEFMFPNDQERNIVLDFMAFNLKFPGRKILWSLLVQGAQGTGKSYIGDVLVKLLGERNVSLPSNETIHEVFTGWFKACQLVIVEELMARGRLELMNKLKPIITQPTVLVREMHKPAYSQPNVFNLLMFTNYENAVILEKEDRRYCIIYSPAKVKPIDYYMQLWDWTRANLPVIMNCLLQRDLKDFNHLGHAPMTAGKLNLIKESRTPLVQWIEEGMEDESWPFMGDLVSTNHLAQCLPPGLKSVTTQLLGRALKEAGATYLGQFKLSAGNSVRMWCLRNLDMWLKAEKDEVVASYEQWSMTNEPGGNPLADAKPM
jgi:hypothetical protein